MKADIFELRDRARKLDLANRVMLDEDTTFVVMLDENVSRRLAEFATYVVGAGNETLAQSLGRMADSRPACECTEGSHPCEVILTVVDRGVRCKECTVGAHYH